MECLRQRESRAPSSKLLDARCASYRSVPGTPPSNGLEAVASGQALCQIPDTTAPPYRHVCYLEITPKGADGPRLQGSGWLAGPRTVITAGHCVFQRNLNSWASSIRVSIAFDGVTEHYPPQDSHNLQSVEQWTQDGLEAYDYGAIILPQPVEAGYFGFRNVADADLLHLLVSLLGYPTQHNATMWGDQGFLLSATPTQIFYPMEAIPGMSGGPVFVTLDGKRYVVGIHNYGGAVGNYATRINSVVWNDIRVWVNDFAS